MKYPWINHDFLYNAPYTLLTDYNFPAGFVVSMIEWSIDNKNVNSEDNRIELLKRIDALSPLERKLIGIE